MSVRDLWYIGSLLFPVPIACTFHCVKSSLRSRLLPRCSIFLSRRKALFYDSWLYSVGAYHLVDERVDTECRLKLRNICSRLTRAERLWRIRALHFTETEHDIHVLPNADVYVALDIVSQTTSHLVLCTLKFEF